MSYLIAAYTIVLASFVGYWFSLRSRRQALLREAEKPQSTGPS